MRCALAQIPVLAGDPASNFACMRDVILKAHHLGIEAVFFPEMALPGYFIGDRWEQSSFLKECEYWRYQFLELSQNIHIVFGSVGIDDQYQSESGGPRLYNAIFHIYQGQFQQNQKTDFPFWPKTLLPNDRPFSDSRYFYDLRRLAQERRTTVDCLYDPLILTTQTNPATKFKVAPLVCEDGWPEHYSLNPIELWNHHTPDFFVSLNASPFSWKKQKKRQENFQSLVEKYQIPIAYVNCIGTQNIGKTIYGFDGCSSLYQADPNETYIGTSFEEELLIFDVKPHQERVLFIPLQGSQPNLAQQKNDDKTKILAKSLEYILKRTMEEWQLSQVVIAVSGGIDSALSATLFSQILGPKNVSLVTLPSAFNSSLTQKAAKDLAKNLGCFFTSLSIEDSLALTKKQIEALPFSNAQHPLSAHVLENIQARDRGSRLTAACAAHLQGVFPCNANKSELTAGWGTLYGDLTGFLCPLGDLWKTDVYALARHYNATLSQPVIPQETLDVVPSAELSTEHDITQNKGDPFHYSYHDALFAFWVEQHQTPEESLYAYIQGTLAEKLGCESQLIQRLFPEPMDFIRDLEKWWRAYQTLGAFKRVQAPPLIALSTRPFGFDHREAVGMGAFFSTAYAELKNQIILQGRVSG